MKSILPFLFAFLLVGCSGTETPTPKDESTTIQPCGRTQDDAQEKSTEDDKNANLGSSVFDVQILSDSVATITLMLETEGSYNYDLLSLISLEDVNEGVRIPTFDYKGKTYKPILKAYLGKDVEKFRTDSLYKESDAGGIGIISQISVSEENKHFCCVDGVLYSKDMTRLVWCPAVKTGRFVVPASVKTIGAGAFFESRLTEVVLPEGLVEIEECAFCNCMRLHDVVLPASLEIVGESAFDFQRNEGYGFYKSISVNSLENHIAKRSYTIPRNSNLKKVGNTAFPFGKRVYLPKTVTVLPATFGNPYFEVDADNIAFTAENGVLFNKDKSVLLSFPYNSDSSYTVPASVRTIGKEAFANNHSLKNLDMGENVKYIDSAAFHNCSGVKKLFCRLH